MIIMIIIIIASILSFKQFINVFLFSLKVKSCCVLSHPHTELANFIHCHSPGLCQLAISEGCQKHWRGSVLCEPRLSTSDL